MGIKKRVSTTSPCANLRAAYHDCFNRWYSEKFSKGQWDKEECVSEWDKYRACLNQHMEDKHLSRLLEEAATYSWKDDSGHPVDADGASQ
ncbi:protein phosphatase [Tasmannia lanceolata]|uniref:protein phosphatase n=1 Tax=Tasmannia lanceolata TaxID=3420 RepID=UPI00406447E6